MRRSYAHIPSLSYDLEKLVEETSCGSPVLPLKLLCLESLVVDLTTTRVNIDVLDRHPALSLPDEADEVEDDDDEDGEVALEEC